MWRRFAAYGAVGWLLEVAMTSLTSVLTGRDRSATASTYLWMHPIYGVGGLILERVARWPRMRRQPRLARNLAYLPVIYGVEYASGLFLRRLLGRCPWDYSACRWNVSGVIRLDYVPLWFVVACLFEPVRDALKPTGAPAALEGGARAAAIAAEPPIATEAAPTHLR